VLDTYGSPASNSLETYGSSTKANQDSYGTPAADVLQTYGSSDDLASYGSGVNDIKLSFFPPK
jgi:hypothetical protein